MSNEVVDGEAVSAQSLASDSMDTAACGVGDQRREMVNGKISWSTIKSEVSHMKICL